MANIARFFVAGQSLVDRWFRFETPLEAFKQEFLRHNPQYDDVELVDIAYGGSAILSASAEYVAGRKASDGRSAAEVEKARQNFWYDEDANAPGNRLELALDRIADERESRPDRVDLGIIWAQGEGDTGVVKTDAMRAAYAEGLEYVFDALRDATGAEEVYIQQLGRRSFFSEEGSAGGADDIQRIQYESSGVIATSIYDLELSDKVHTTPAATEIGAARMARFISLGEQGPMFDSASLTTSTLTFTLDLASGTTLHVGADAELYVEIFDAFGRVNATEARLAGPNQVVFDLERTPYGEVRISYGAPSATTDARDLDPIWAESATPGLADLDQPLFTFYETLDAAFTLAPGEVPDDLTNVLDATEGEDLMVGTAAGERIKAKAGDDAVYGRGGDDLIYGEEGADRLYGEGGDDRVVGGDGDDEIWGGDGDDILEGRDGDDTAYGGAGGDRIKGQDGADTLYGEAGDDDISGEEGDDTLYGGDGDDVLRGQSGDDTLYGEQGADNMKGGDGADRLEGGAGDDRIQGENGDDTLLGGAGSDRVNGGDGADRLFGGAGADKLDGDGGDDTLVSDGDRDELIGGGGADTFLFTASADQAVIVDFESGVDILRVDGSHLSDANGDGAITVLDLEATLRANGSGEAMLDLGDGAWIRFKDLTLNDLTSADYELI